MEYYITTCHSYVMTIIAIAMLLLNYKGGISYIPVPCMVASYIYNIYNNKL